MTPGEGKAQGARRTRVESRVEEIRGALATTTEPTVRARLRVRLADLLVATGEVQVAAGELRQAVAEGPTSAGLLFGMRAVARRLPTAETEDLVAVMRFRRTTRGESGQTAAARSSRPARSGQTGPFRPIGVASPVQQIPIAPWPATTREAVPAMEPIDLASAALTEGKPIQARRLGEEAARAGHITAREPGRVGALVKALEQAGAKRESLKLARTLIEGDGDDAPALEIQEALTQIIRKATDQGDPELAGRWSTDLDRFSGGLIPKNPRTGADARATTSDRFREAQRMVLQAVDARPSSDAAIAGLMPLLGGQAHHHGAVTLAERLSEAQGQTSPASRAELLGAAYEGERIPRRRQRLAARWADALKSVGDDAGALSVLVRAIDELPSEASSDLRRMRAELLRVPGRESELSQAIDADAEVAVGQARRDLRAEQARLLDRVGEFDAALEVRLRALVDFPGEPSLFAPARQRLESIGRLDRSLDLATAALSHVTDRSSRAALLRDIATLSEATTGDRTRAAVAWQEVLALVPDDQAAVDAAERFYRQNGDADRLGGLLATAASREVEPAVRMQVIWRLAEFRRTERQAPLVALPLYREIVASGIGNHAGLSFADEDWQRRDDLLAVHTARALAASTATDAARALADRADLLITAERWEDADRDLKRALDLDPEIPDALRAMGRLYELRGDLRGLRQQLTARVENATGMAAGQLWFEIGRASEGMGDLSHAVSAYDRSMAADPTLRSPITSLRHLAAARGDFSESARLLEKEISLGGTPLERIALSVEFGVLLATKLDAASRAVEVLDSVLALDPTHAGAVDAMFSAALTAGVWEKSAQALETALAGGVGVADASQRYHRLGLAAEKAGQVDRALGFYSRSYARNPAYRPTLERLSEICFERQQWENAWKATEHLIERHGSDLDADTRAELSLRSGLADLHVAQRLVAANRLPSMLVGSVSSAALRDVADSWASMRFEPRLLAEIDADRKSRATARLTGVSALTHKNPGHAARSIAFETLAALAMADRRWVDAISALDSLGADTRLDSGRRCLYLVAAGDILLHRRGDVAGAALRHQRARALNPKDARLARVGMAIPGENAPTGPRGDGDDGPTPGPIGR